MNRTSNTFCFCVLLIGLMINGTAINGQTLSAVDSFPRDPAYQSGFVYPTIHGSRYFVRYGIDFPPEVVVTDLTGTVTTRATVAFPDAPYVRITSAAVADSGRIAISFLGRDDEGRLARGIAWVAVSGAVEFVVRTDEFAAEHLRFASDGTLWVLARTNRVDLLTRFDLSGRPMMTPLEFPRIAGPNFEPISTALFTDGQTVGILMNAKGAWIEVSPDGHMIGEWALPAGQGLEHRIEGAAMTESGDVYVSTTTKIPSASGTNESSWEGKLLRLDRQLNRWSEVDYLNLRSPGDPKGINLLGSTEDDLIVQVVDPSKYLIARVIP